MKTGRTLQKISPPCKLSNKTECILMLIKLRLGLPLPAGDIADCFEILVELSNTTMSL